MTKNKKTTAPSSAKQQPENAGKIKKSTVPAETPDNDPHRRSQPITYSKREKNKPIRSTTSNYEHNPNLESNPNGYNNSNRYNSNPNNSSSYQLNNTEENLRPQEASNIGHELRNDNIRRDNELRYDVRQDNHRGNAVRYQDMDDDLLDDGIAGVDRNRNGS